MHSYIRIIGVIFLPSFLPSFRSAFGRNTHTTLVRGRQKGPSRPTYTHILKHTHTRSVADGGCLIHDRITKIFASRFADGRYTLRCARIRTSGEGLGEVGDFGWNICANIYNINMIRVCARISGRKNARPDVACVLHRVPEPDRDNSSDPRPDKSLPTGSANRILHVFHRYISPIPRNPGT